MSLEDVRQTIIHKRCYENANPSIRCPNAGVTQVTLINRIREDGRLKQITEKGWGCKDHA